MYKLSESVEFLEIEPMGAKLWPFEGGGRLSPFFFRIFEPEDSLLGMSPIK